MSILSNWGTLKIDSLSIKEVEIRTQKLGFDPPSRGCESWDACLKLPGELHSVYGDDKFHIVKILVEVDDELTLVEMNPNDLEASDLPSIRKLEVSISVPSIDGDHPSSHIHTFDKLL